MIAYDSQGRVTQANHAAVEMLGFASEQDIVGSLAVDAGWHRTDTAGRPGSEEPHPPPATDPNGQPQLPIVERLHSSHRWGRMDPGYPRTGDRRGRGVPSLPANL